MWEEPHEFAMANGWAPVVLRDGAVRLRVPPTWRSISRDDGGLAFQSPGTHPVDLLITMNVFQNPYGVSIDDAIQYLDRENVLPHGIDPAEDENDSDRRWITYTISQPPNRLIYVWKVADFSDAKSVRLVTLQLLVPEIDRISRDDLAGLVNRLAEETNHIEFRRMKVAEPVEQITKRNVGYGDQLRFRLPWQWQSHKDGDLLVFLDEEGPGTLRLAVHSFPCADLESADGPEERGEIIAMVRATLLQTAQQFADGPDGRIGKGKVEELPDGEILARFLTEGEEDGEKLSFHLWLRGAALEGQTTLALFSFALPIDHSDTDDGRRVLAMLDAEIRASIIGDVAPTTEE